MCDFLIASPDARFADTHARVGVARMGTLSAMPRLIGINRAKELSLTGNYLDAETACAWGLITKLSAQTNCYQPANSWPVTSRPPNRSPAPKYDASWTRAGGDTQ